MAKPETRRNASLKLAMALLLLSITQAFAPPFQGGGFWWLAGGGDDTLKVVLEAGKHDWLHHRHPGPKQRTALRVLDCRHRHHDPKLHCPTALGLAAGVRIPSAVDADGLTTEFDDVALNGAGGSTAGGLLLFSGGEGGGPVGSGGSGSGGSGTGGDGSNGGNGAGGSGPNGGGIGGGDPNGGGAPGGGGPNGGGGAGDPNGGGPDGGGLNGGDPGGGGSDGGPDGKIGGEPDSPCSLDNPSACSTDPGDSGSGCLINPSACGGDDGGTPDCPEPALCALAPNDPPASTAVPEPSTLWLMGAGAAALMARRRRRAAPARSA